MRSATDAEIVSWIGRLGAVGTEHVAAMFEMERDIAHARVACLQRDGMLERAQRQDDRQCLYWASTTGLSRCGLDRLGRWQYNPVGFDHAWQIAQVTVELMRGLPEWDVLSAREITAIETDSGEPFASVVIGEAGRHLVHVPTLVLSSPRARVVPVEVEPQLDTGSSLLSVCRGWARSRHVNRVYWLEAGPGFALRRAVRDAHAGDRVTVLGVDDISLLVASECAREEVNDALI